jgi:hypothetical protein
MKKTLFYVFAILTFFNFPAFAIETVTITGEPVELAPVVDTQDTYTLPADYTVQTYNYVNFDGASRVCYVAAQQFPSTIEKIIKVNGTTWYCYEANQPYFRIISP